MLKFLIGPVLVGVGYGAGSYYGSDAEQLVHKSPSVTYASVETALGNMRQSGTTFFDGGTPVPYELHIDHTLDQRLVLTLWFAGKQGAEAEGRQYDATRPATDPDADAQHSLERRNSD